MFVHVQWLESATAEQLAVGIPLGVLAIKEFLKYFVGDRDREIVMNGLRAGGTELPWIAFVLVIGVAANQSAPFWAGFSDRSAAVLALVVATVVSLILAIVSIWCYKVATLNVRDLGNGRSRNVIDLDESGEPSRGSARRYVKPALLIVGSYLAGGFPLGWIAGQL